MPTDTTRSSDAEGRDSALVETPSNPGLDVCDLAAVADAAHAAGALVAVDNTLATPLGQRPLDLGADFGVPAHQGAGGHADLLMGAVTRDARWPSALRAGGRRSARSPGRSRPGSRTARSPRSACGWSARGERARAGGLALARADVADVRHPGLAGHPP